VTAPKNPGAQAVQAATDVLPAAPPVVVTPAGHGVQLAEPAEAYEPAAQLEHAKAPATAKEPAAQMLQPVANCVPGRETVPAKPGAHAVHSAMDAAPGLAPAVVTP
jgi:hypothetical protein